MLKAHGSTKIRPSSQSEIFETENRLLPGASHYLCTISFTIVCISLSD